MKTSKSTSRSLFKIKYISKIFQDFSVFNWHVPKSFAKSLCGIPLFFSRETKHNYKELKNTKSQYNREKTNKTCKDKENYHKNTENTPLDKDKQWRSRFLCSMLLFCWGLGVWFLGLADPTWQMNPHLCLIVNHLIDWDVFYQRLTIQP